jgi:hypothetical protein
VTAHAIPNETLSLDDIPADEAPWSEIARFALTFNGYAEWGRAHCAEIANARRAGTLTDIRTCLFFEQRRHNHFGREPDAKTMPYIRGLVAQIREKVTLGGRSC